MCPKKKRSGYNDYMRTYMLDRYRRRRAAAEAERGGACERCGNVDNLHFHHRNPAEKAFTIARGSSFSEKRWRTELDKCDLLCETCHIQQHTPP
jgi:5-methylcytosine-specific restriction endonuclease McrA